MSVFEPSTKWSRATPNGLIDGRLNPDTLFDIDVPDEGSNIAQRTFYFLGKLAVEQSNAHIGDADIRYDPHAGAHGFFEEWFSTTGFGTIDSKFYARVVSTLSENNSYYQELFAESDKNMELRVGEEHYTTQILRGNSATDYEVPFCLRLIIPINNTDKPLNFQRMGNLLRLSGRTRSVRSALHGADCNSTDTNFYIQDPELYWLRTGEDADPGAITMQYITGIQQPVNSNNVNISVGMPAQVSSAFMTFIPVSSENSYTENASRTAVVPNVTRVQFAFNDVDNKKISFPLESVEEVALNFHRAVSAGNPLIQNSCLLSRTDVNEPSDRGYGIGCPFGQLNNLTSTKFSFNLRSGVTNNDPYTCFICFKAIKAF